MPKPTTNPLQRMVSKFRDVLAETERLPPDKLRAYQENLLAPLLLHARHNVPFYRDRLASLCSQTDVDLARWRTIPILTREDLQRNLKALSASSVPAHLGSTSHGETSGSSGRPIRYLVNELANVASLGTTDRIFRWWGFNGEKAMANFVARHGEDARPPDGKTESGWRIGHAGMHHMLDLSADTGTQLEWLCKRRPNYLTAHSFVLNEVAKLALQRKQHIKLERIISIGTVLTDDIRKVCKMAFGVEPIDQYGAQETGLLACECPWCGRLHVNAETVLVEILDSDGKPCPPGEAGRVIVTSFYNYAMPLIRYEIGDFAAAAHEQPKCSTRLPALEKIMGRYRNAFTLRNGRTIYPYVPVSHLQKYLSFAQVQIVQTDLTSIEVRYVPLNRNENVNRDGLETCLRALIDPSFNVEAVAVDEISRSPSGKFEDYLSLLARQEN